MINHITLFVSDLAASKKFFANSLQPLGYKIIEEDSAAEEGERWVGLAIHDVQGQRDVWIKERKDTKPSGSLSCLAFTAASKDMVNKFYQAGLEAGGTDNGPPGYRPKYWADYYAAFVLDPDGNNIEVVFDDRAVKN